MILSKDWNESTWRKPLKVWRLNTEGVEERDVQQSSCQEDRGGSAGRSPAAACGECTPKKLASLGFGERAMPAEKSTGSPNAKARILLTGFAAGYRSTAQCNVLLSSETDEENG